MKKYFLVFLLSIFLSLSVKSANAFINDDDYVEYQIMFNGYKIGIDRVKFNNYISAIDGYLKSLMMCKKNLFNYENPILGSRGYYSVLGENRFGGCIVEVVNNNISKHKCALSKNEINSIVKSKMENIKDRKNLEYFNDVERDIYYNKDFCRIEIINQVKETSKKDLDKVLSENPNLKAALEIMK